MTLRGWSQKNQHHDPNTTPLPVAAASRLRGPWSLLATLEHFGAELTAHEDRLEPLLQGELSSKIGQAARDVRVRGRTELADALGRAESALSRIAALSTVRRTELVELGRISRALPSLLFDTSTHPSLARVAAPPLARVRVRATSENDALAAQRPLAGRTIVIVNEDREVAWSQNEVLHDAGATVRLAYDGHDALEVSRKIIPDAIVADAFMSGFDGVALARRLRKHSLLRDMGVVLVGARRSLLDRLAKLGAQADGYLMDKADAPSIQNCVANSIVARRALESELSNTGSVRGSLALIAPRTLLVATARLRFESTVTIRQRTEFYEAKLREGALVDMFFTADRGGTLKGREALKRCLCLREGEFCVGPITGVGSS